MMCGTYGGMTVMMIGGWVFYLALLVLAVLAIVWLVRSLRRPAAGAPSTESAEDVLRRRYAAGEISDEEYRQRLAQLRT